jgi:hypothetical protein
VSRERFDGTIDRSVCLRAVTAGPCDARPSVSAQGFNRVGSEVDGLHDGGSATGLLWTVMFSIAGECADSA